MPQVILNDNTGKELFKRVNSDFVSSEHFLIISFDEVRRIANIFIDICAA